MLIVISPAKKLDYETPINLKLESQPSFIPEASQLIDGLRLLSQEEVGKLMKLSPTLADLNYSRYQEWEPTFTTPTSRQAIFAFNGEVYTGLDARSMDDNDLAYAQGHLRILSGVYGLLKPLDLIRPYRLEMGTKFSAIKDQKNLYEFWGSKITDAVNELMVLQEDGILLNLASNEYFKSLKKKELKGEIITPVFKDFKNGSFKTIMMYAKKARGSMASWIIKNKIEEANKLKLFDVDGYTYNDDLSKENDWVFTR